MSRKSSEVGNRDRPGRIPWPTTFLLAGYFLSCVTAICFRDLYSPVHAQRLAQTSGGSARSVYRDGFRTRVHNLEISSAGIYLAHGLSVVNHNQSARGLDAEVRDRTIYL